MAYYGCQSIEQMTLGIGGDFTLPLDHADNQKVLALCCEERNVPAVPLGNTAEETLERFLGMRHRFVVRGGVLTSPPDENSPCAKCPCYAKKDWGYSMQISRVMLAMNPTVCQGRCSYCGPVDGIIKTNKPEEVAAKLKSNPNVSAGYQKVFDVLNLAKAEKIISPDARWIIASGEITVHPYRKEILNLVRGYAVSFYTNAFIFDKDIARELHDNPRAAINLSIDSGTAETWRKVKCVDNFAQVIENLKNYSAVAHHPEQITLKYIVLPGKNDTEEDFVSFVNMKKLWHMKLSSISRDARFFSKLSGIDGAVADKVFDPKLIESAARLSAIHMKAIGPVSFSNFTPEEERQTLILAEEILKYI